MTFQPERHLLLYPNTGIGSDLKTELESYQWQVHIADTLAEAMQISNKFNKLVGLCFLENDQGQTNIEKVRELLAEFQQKNRPLLWIMGLYNYPCDSIKNEHEACALIAKYCYDFLKFPASTEKVLFVLGHAFGMSEMHVCCGEMLNYDFPARFGIIGNSSQIMNVFNRIDKVAKEDCAVLIEGETGTGKELVANAIHQQSRRADQPFVAINCGAFPKELIQAELFGHEKGAFTGAQQRRIGRIECAQDGTLFLDEIGDLPMDQQVNLLRFLEEKTIERIGGSEKITVDARIISATHINLKQAVANDRFREDLYYRLKVLQLSVPPLREREEDKEILARYFFNKFAKNHPYKAKGFNNEALHVINQYDWPGNIRES